MQKIATFDGKAAQKNFRITARLKAGAPPRKSISLFNVVIEFAVVGKHKIGVRELHRLASADQVEDTQSGMR